MLSCYKNDHFLIIFFWTITSLYIFPHFLFALDLVKQVKQSVSDVNQDRNLAIYEGVHLAPIILDFKMIKNQTLEAN